METSIYLAKVIGLISVVSATAVLVRYRESTVLEDEAVKNPALAYISGFFILILGALMVVSHSVWAKDWRLVITIIGWLMFIKGALRIFFPGAVKYMLQKKRHNRWFMLGEVALILVGLYLLYYGFIVY